MVWVLFWLFFFFHLLPINEGENELDFLEGEKKKSSLPHNIPPQHLVSERSLQPLTGCVAQSHRTVGGFFPLFFPSIVGFIIDHNAPATSAAMSLSTEESRPLGQPLQNNMVAQEERRLCAERAHLPEQSSPSKEGGEKAPLQKAGPIPAELRLPSQSGSAGQPPAGAWEPTGEALGGRHASAVTGPKLAFLESEP